MIRILLPASLFLAGAPLFAQKTYSYASVPGDPMEARIYTLENGFQVYLSRNTDAPRVQTNIAVRAGSKNDPADATGLAHYLEHMLFKGTSTIGTADWTRESALLQQISDLYEQRRSTTDEQQRAVIYHRIDSLSTLAATVAIPNEYDKMVSSMGAQGTNAFTSTERTVYVNDIPSEELERWMMIESVRFQECVLRLFHTELETVYEEFNRGQDSDQRNAAKAMNELLYKKHPYGTQTTIGTGEHLKNPSMEKIQQYFHTYYVPNNMALILAGDIDYDATIAMADKHFGGWKVGTVPPFTFTGEDPIQQPETVEVFGPMAEWVSLAWRFGGYRADDPLVIELISGILSNGRAGLIDLNLLQDQKVLSAGAFALVQNDYSQLSMRAEARQGQTLEEARDLLLGQLDLLKQGAFDDWMIEAVVNNYRQQRLRQWTDNNGSRASALTDAFILRKRWEDVVDRYDRMARITRQQVMDFATKHFGANYACVLKRTGENTNAYRVAKPPITPIDINRDDRSAWRKRWEAVSAAKMVPQFVDYQKAITRRALAHDVELAYVANPSNELFSLVYILDMGTNNDRELRLAVELMPYLGTGTYSPAEFRKELFKLGLSLNVSAGEDRVHISVSGLEKNLDRGVELLEHLLADARPDEEALSGLISDIVKERQDDMKNKGIILNNALYSYARYGERSPFNDVLSEDEMKEIPISDLIDRIHALTAYQHRVFYYGRRPVDDVVALLNTAHKTPAEPTAYPVARDYKELATTENTVLFVDHDMVQTEMIMVSKADLFDKKVLPYAALFNEYFGSGLSSIVFQENREAKALAYSASAAYTTPAKKEEAHFVRAAIGTQADKLDDAVTAMLALMNDMPMDEPQFLGARDAALKTIASTRITKENIFWSWDAAQRRGLDHDVRKEVYEQLPGIALKDLKGFFDQRIKGRPYTFLVIGKEGTMDMGVLERLGRVRKLSKQEIFGYGEVKLSPRGRHVAPRSHLRGMSGACVFTIDVEDWFHILDLPSTPRIEQWPGLKSDVERNTRRMLVLLREHEIRATLFFLGWVAERWPQLVREAVADGHEIASHGYAHELVYTVSSEHFLADIRKARDIIEQAGGVKVLGYRCPGFSVTAATPWFFDRVKEAGYAYDSSVFPGQRGHGGLPGARTVPHVIATGHGDLVEFPISLGRMFGRPMYFFGGGYLRFFPYRLIKRKVKEVLAEKRPVVFYLHPREIDPSQPRLPMDARRRFMTYVGIASTEPKMRALFRDFRFTTFGALMSTVERTGVHPSITNA